MKIFSVTVLIFLTHSLSLTMGTRASLILSGMGPAENINNKTFLLVRNFLCEAHRTPIFIYTLIDLIGGHF